MECGGCAGERQRRRRVIPIDNPEAVRYGEEPFAHAPYVHPFRHPSFHAQQLRALSFAKARNSRVLWVAAYDKLLRSDESHRKDKA